MRVQTVTGENQLFLLQSGSANALNVRQRANIAQLVRAAVL
jgi:hypothetical protein